MRVREQFNPIVYTHELYFLVSLVFYVISPHPTHSLRLLSLKLQSHNLTGTHWTWLVSAVQNILQCRNLSTCTLLWLVISIPSPMFSHVATECFSSTGFYSFFCLFPVSSFPECLYLTHTDWYHIYAGISVLRPTQIYPVLLGIFKKV